MVPSTFINCVPPSPPGDPYVNNWTLSTISHDRNKEIGTWTVTVQVKLQNYPTMIATDQLTVIVVDRCPFTAINTQTLTPASYQIQYSVTTPQTILSFPMNTDTYGLAYGTPLLCGPKKYITGIAWLSVLSPADPETQNFQL